MPIAFCNIGDFVTELRRRSDLIEITAEVDPHLELAEIHRRVIAESGPALLFSRVKNSPYPVVTNLFGTTARVELAFGDEPIQFVKEAANLPHELLPPSIGKFWQQRKFFARALKVGIKQTNYSLSDYELHKPANLLSLPVITSWPLDGGPFVTLPLVYTEHPDTRIHNLGIYRMQRFDAQSTGMHMQIAKGGGFHLARAAELGRKLPLNVFIGGPPAAILAAISPLPENVPELLLASLALGKKLRMFRSRESPLPILAESEFVIFGDVDPSESHLEGPFGDHYGYYSLEHEFPIFRCRGMLVKKGAIYPATVVGKPRQEDYYIGNYLQKLLSPLFPVVMPAVRDLWSYGETGYHSLAAAVVRERYRREAVVSAFRILGEGQLSLTKFLLLVDRPMDLQDFRAVLQYILERADFSTDLYVFTHTSMDTLDYAGPKLNEGSKGLLLGVGDPIRTLPEAIPTGDLSGVKRAKIFCPGCLVVTGPSYVEDKHFAQTLAKNSAISTFPLIILCDNAEFSTSSAENFLWATFTRFEPARDIHAKEARLESFHPHLTPPIVIDSRMKPWYPAEVEADDETIQLVNRRWKQYFGASAR